MLTKNYNEIQKSMLKVVITLKPQGKAAFQRSMLLKDDYDLKASRKSRFSNRIRFDTS